MTGDNGKTNPGVVTPPRSAMIDLGELRGFQQR